MIPTPVRKTTDRPLAIEALASSDSFKYDPEKNLPAVSVVPVIYSAL